MVDRVIEVGPETLMRRFTSTMAKSPAMHDLHKKTHLSKTIRLIVVRTPMKVKCDGWKYCTVPRETNVAIVADQLFPTP